MPRYFLHLHNDTDTIDEEGCELPDTAAAMAKARSEAQNMAAHSVESCGHLMLDHYVRVTDELGDIVGTVTFGEAVEVGVSRKP